MASFQPDQDIDREYDFISEYEKYPLTLVGNQYFKDMHAIASGDHKIRISKMQGNGVK